MDITKKISVDLAEEFIETKTAASHPLLVIIDSIDEEDIGIMYSVLEDESTIGRSELCTIPIHGNNISRNHAKLLKTEHGFQLEDLNSTNGTYVNGESISISPLKHGDQIRIGQSVVLKFFCEDPLESKYLKHQEELRHKNIELTMLNDLLKEAKHEAEQANKAKTDFLNNMSHELRTPLTSIIGFADLLIENTAGELNTEQKDFMQGILESSNYLLSLINDILDLSKLEAGEERLRLRTFDLNDLLEQCFLQFKQEALAKHIDLHLDISENKLLTVADPVKITQIVINLLSNALKFTPLKSKVGIKLVNLPYEYQICIWDHGPGIPPEFQKKIFHKFYQIPDHMKQKAKGTGLGLSICKSLIRLHQGDIWVESNKEQPGSRFYFSLPKNVDYRIFISQIQSNLDVAQKLEHSFAIMVCQLQSEQHITDKILFSTDAFLESFLQKKQDHLFQVRNGIWFMVLSDITYQGKQIVLKRLNYALQDFITEHDPSLSFRSKILMYGKDFIKIQEVFHQLQEFDILSIAELGIQDEQT